VNKSSRAHYTYTVKTVADARENDTIYVPNCNADNVVQIWRWLSGLRKTFPQYDDGLLMTGLDEGAWCRPQIYREERYCPLDMPCIVRVSKTL
jgi:hypothetical protein